MKIVPLTALMFLCVAACDDGKPIVLTSARMQSPDGQLVAIVESVDNGLGFGQGIAYDEIHVGTAGLAPVEHGDPDQSVVFYASQESSTDIGPDIKWIDAQHLLVVYDPKRKPQKLLRSVGGVQIEYRARAAP